MCDKSAFRLHPRRDRPGDEPDSRFENAHRKRQQCLHLVAAMFAMQTPLAKVFAVVAEYPVAIFTDPGTRTADDFNGIEVVWGAATYPQGASTCELSERNFLNGPAMQATHPAGIVNHVPAADIDSMVKVAPARCDDVGTEGQVRGSIHREFSRCLANETVLLNCLSHGVT